MALSEKVSVEVEVRGKDNLSLILDAQKRKAQELAQQQAKMRAATGDVNARPPTPPPVVTAPPPRMESEPKRETSTRVERVREVENKTPPPLETPRESPRTERPPPPRPPEREDTRPPTPPVREVTRHVEPERPRIETPRPPEREVPRAIEPARPLPAVESPPVREAPSLPERAPALSERPRNEVTRHVEPERPRIETPRPPERVRTPPARSAPVPFQSEAVREVRNKARAEAQGLPYQSERVARLRDEAREAAMDKTVKENAKAADAEKKLGDARVRSGKAAIQLLPGVGQLAGGFEGLQQTIEGLAESAGQMNRGGRGPGLLGRAVGFGGVALAGAVGGGLTSGIGRNAMASLGGGHNAQEVAGVASGALGGAAAGALAGSILPGVGTAVGAVVGSIGGIFTSLVGGADRARKAAESFEAVWREAEAKMAESGRRTLDFEERSDSLATRGEATRSDLEAVLSPFAMGLVARSSREDRVHILERELRGARKRDTVEGTAESRFRIEALELAIARGVSGVTRRTDADIRTGFGDATSVSDAIFEAMAARSPSVEAADRTTEEVRVVGEAIGGLTREVRDLARALAPGV